MGYNDLVGVSCALANFMGVSPDTISTRNLITKAITKYIKANGLQDPVDKRNILVDDRLKTLFTVKKDAHLTYFNLSTYVRYHVRATT